MPACSSTLSHAQFICCLKFEIHASLDLNYLMMSQYLVSGDSKLFILNGYTCPSIRLFFREGVGSFSFVVAN